MALHVWAIDDGNDWVVANDKAEALALWAKHIGESLDDYPDLDCDQIPDDMELTVDVEGVGDRVKHSAMHWANREGPGFFAGMEY